MKKINRLLNTTGIVVPRFKYFPSKTRLLRVGFLPWVNKLMDHHNHKRCLENYFQGIINLILKHAQKSIGKQEVAHFWSKWLAGVCMFAFWKEKNCSYMLHVTIPAIIQSISECFKVFKCFNCSIRHRSFCISPLVAEVCATVMLLKLSAFLMKPLLVRRHTKCNSQSIPQAPDAPRSITCNALQYAPLPFP